MDTAKDARVLILEDALKRLDEIISNRKLKFHIDYGLLGKAVQRANGFFYEVKFSYIDPKSLAEMSSTNQLVSSIHEVGEAFHKALKSTGYSPNTPKDALTLAEMEYSLRIVGGFQNRLLNFSDDPAFAVDLLAVEIGHVEQIAGSKNLTLCRCSDGKQRWQIVTNLQDIKSGMRLPCAVLPPAEMMGVVSEAMFLGLEELGDSYEIGPLSKPSPKALDSARGQVMQIIKRLM